mmetsp:Transcript_21604/g.51590  ORF Transcript_21604/g.51590 Transcript_21604/m.51590 type:complete len:323 (+) Transcript_21604:2402-3370(+)
MQVTFLPAVAGSKCRLAISKSDPSAAMETVAMRAMVSFPQAFRLDSAVGSPRISMRTTLLGSACFTMPTRSVCCCAVTMSASRREDSETPVMLVLRSDQKKSCLETKQLQIRTWPLDITAASDRSPGRTQCRAVSPPFASAFWSRGRWKRPCMPFSRADAPRLPGQCQAARGWSHLSTSGFSELECETTSFPSQSSRDTSSVRFLDGCRKQKTFPQCVCTRSIRGAPTGDQSMNLIPVHSPGAGDWQLSGFCCPRGTRRTVQSLGSEGSTRSTLASAPDVGKSPTATRFVTGHQARGPAVGWPSNCTSKVRFVSVIVLVLKS